MGKTYEETLLPLGCIPVQLLGCHDKAQCVVRPWKLYQGSWLSKTLGQEAVGFSCPGFSCLLFLWQAVCCKILQHDQDELFQDLLAGSAISMHHCKGTSSSHVVGGCCWHLMAHHITRAQQSRQGCHTEWWDAWEFLWSHSLFFNTGLAQLASACVKRLNQAVTLSF